MTGRRASPYAPAVDGYRGVTALLESAWEELTGPDPDRRDLCLETVSDVLETGRLTQDDAERTVERLVTVALSAERYVVLESALHAVSTAAVHHDLPYRVVEPLAVGADGFEPLLLIYVLGILADTQDQAALPVLGRFLRHPHPEVRTEAAEALRDLCQSLESPQG